MIIPKKLRMFGYDWKVVHNEKEEGGSYEWKTKTIRIGKLYGEEMEVLLHEICEAILMDLGYRFYGQEKNMEYTFHFDHTGLCRFHKALFKILSDNKLLK